MSRSAALFFFLLLPLPPPLLADGAVYLVAPFANRSTEPTLDWIGESISETVREALQSHGLGIARRDEREAAARKLGLGPGPQRSLASTGKIAEAVQAGWIIYGQFDLVQTEGAPRSLRIEGRILNLEQKRELAEFSETGAFDDLALLQTRLAWQALQAIRPAEAGSREEFLRRHPAVKVTALENYIRGLLAPSPEIRHRLFTQAVRLDESLRGPFFYLGQLHWKQEKYDVAVQWLERMTPQDEHFLEGRFMLGMAKHELSDFEAARQAFEFVLETTPRSEVYNNLGAAQLRLNHPAGLDNLRKAMELDPAIPEYHFNAGYALWKRGEFEAAAERFRAVLDRSPEDQDALQLLGRCLKRSGPRQGEWRTEGLERLREIPEETAGSPRNQGH